MNVGTLLRAPVSRRAWQENLYVLTGTPLAAAGFCYAVITLVLGAGLAVTAVGIPLLAFGLAGARRIGGLHRWLAGRLLGERIEPPAPRLASGFYGRVQALLGDAAGWRALGYLLMRLPVAVLQVYVVALSWGWGLVGLTYPLLQAFGLNAIDRPDELVFPTGIALLLIAPWATRGVVLVDRMLMRWLLGRRGLSERVRDLERTRARAVDDAAATLRRIERDLHDGAQVRLTALIMQLTMMRELAPAGQPQDLTDTALTTAKEAVVELRELVRGIHPPVLDQGLDVALATLAARSGVSVDLRTDIGPRPTAAIESITYYCAAELLANVAKHSGATRAWLSVDRSGDRLVLRVRDDGAGGAQARAGSGLSGLVDRIRTVDGRLDVISPPGGPTVVTVELPTHA
ncbi:sensor histidine kinase [Actinophytocola sp.]|uniref:sensor histidine kinase n=1 Tax=Actinophytocola sp. TaxID=1872138 RepID=UPI002EDB2360